MGKTPISRQIIQASVIKEAWMQVKSKATTVVH